MTTTLRVAFIGAGAINFGRVGVPWDHASRLEKIGGVDVIAIVDIDTARAEGVLEKRKSSKIFQSCKILKDLDKLIALKPDAVFVGIPPGYRGSFDHDVELKLAKSGINIFVEKPVSVVTTGEFLPYVEAVTQACKENDVVISVGYMFRYHAAVRKMKELIKEHGGKVMAFNALYYCAYSEAKNAFWFDDSLGGGPIVEQATHFCDLARYIVGSEVDLTTINCTMLKDNDKSGAGKISYLKGDFERDIPSEKRIPRVTVAQWRFADAGVGTLMHSVALPGYRYETNIDVQLDCLKLSLIEPYQKHCILRVRGFSDGNPDADTDYTFTEKADSYLTELEMFLRAVREKDQSLIESSYTDAANTYALTRQIYKVGMEN